MWERISLASLGGVAYLLLASTSHAACTIDNDCPGDSICENNSCVAAAAPRSVAPSPAPSNEDPRARKKRNRGPRHSKAMMVTGIVMTSLSGIPLLFAGVGMITGQPKVVVGSLAAVGVLAGVGIPLLVIGAKREPLQKPPLAASLTPWLSPHTGGLGLRLDF
jgi:hypothetical protein